MERLKAKISQRRITLGAAVGSGMSARAAVAGGVDFLMILNAGYFRLHGCSSMAALMPYNNANRLTWDIANRYIAPLMDLKKIPAFIGVCAQDPTTDLNSYIRRVKGLGIKGVTNFPSVGFIDGGYRDALEETELGYDREIEMLAEAKSHGLMTIAFCLKPEEAIKAAEAEVDIINLDLGWAEWRDVDFELHQEAIERAIRQINSTMDRLSQVVENPYVVIFGGPLVLPKDTLQIYQRTEALGYVGGSTIERFPATTIITQTVREFKQAASGAKQMNRFGAMIGVSSSMKKVFEVIKRVAPTKAPVLIIGESGTGKELAAREIHRLSNRSEKPFICWNCGAITETLAISELFGHEKGAFTGAINQTLGKFELAKGGTLFMDEIANLPVLLQAAILRAIQEKEIMRVGGQENIKIDVRIIAASNRDFTRLISDELFRLDLYYRLSTLILKMPPLRDRQEDIPFLIWEFMQEFCRKYSYPMPRIPKSVMDTFVEHPWPGNIRELRNAVECCIILGQGKTFSLECLDEIFRLDRALHTKPIKGSEGMTNQQKRSQLHEVLARHNGNKSATAEELGVSRKTIYDWLSKES